MILEKINKPNDIKALDPIEYNQLADAIREHLDTKKIYQILEEWEQQA